MLDVIQTDTTLLASHGFACEGQLERPDLLALDLYAPAVYSQYTDRVVDPTPGREPAWRVLAELARGVGLDALGRDGDPSIATTDDLLDRVARSNGLDALRANGGGPGPVARAMYDWPGQRLPNGVSLAMGQGTVSLPRGYADSNVNHLISAHDIDPISGMPRLTGTPVTVHRHSEVPRP